MYLSTRCLIATKRMVRLLNETRKLLDATNTTARLMESWRCSQEDADKIREVLEK